MRSRFVLFVILLVYFKSVDGFILYPFNAFEWTKKLLDTIAAKQIIDVKEDLIKYSVEGESCMRECKENDVKICYFNFTLRHYQVMGGSCPRCTIYNSLDSCRSDRCVIADGIPRGFLSINFQLPGPKIQVCKNDIVVVDLHNQAEGLSSTIHWHGIRQHGSQFMDGVPYLTQCPVPFGETFRYSFKVEDEGTHFYHSHSGNQKTDGAFGALIVRGIKENPNAWTYDYDLPEYVILMNDWMHQSADDYMPGFEKRSLLSQSVLINGHGRFFNQTTQTSIEAPLTTFHVESGKRYRFRIVNAASNVCPFLFQIEDHNFTIIASETSYVKPKVINTLYFLAGERFDFVLDTRHKAIRNYWLRFKQLNPCSQDLQGFAIIKYIDGEVKQGERMTVDFNLRVPPKFNENYDETMLLNTPQPGITGYPITSLQDFRDDQILTKGKADQTEYIFFDTPGLPNDFTYSKPMISNYMFTTDSAGSSFIAIANNISFEFPSFTLLSEPEMITDDLFCDKDNIPENRCVRYENKKMCRCTHRIKFALNSIAELIIVNVEDKITHPIHFHGHKFHIIDSGLLRANMSIDEVKDTLTTTEKNFDFPPYKDTVVLPYPGYVKLRFRADNPGFWLLHCHFDWHLPIGMSLIIQVGEIEQMPKAPENFPRCRNYLPKGYL